MNLYICDLLFFEESRTNDRFKARDQGEKELYRNFIKEVIDEGIRAEKTELV